MSYWCYLLSMCVFSNLLHRELTLEGGHSQSRAADCVGGIHPALRPTPSLWEVGL